jgi:hypothetical protein
MASRIVLWERGSDPRNWNALRPQQMEMVREMVRVARFEEDYSVWPKNRDVDSDEEEVVEKSAPARETKQTKSQSKRAGRFRDCGK